MPLSGNEKETALQSLALALDANEPEAMLAELRRMASRKLEDRSLTGMQRERWINVEQALTHAEVEVVAKGEPQPKTQPQPDPQPEAKADEG